eukprot:TRINITY_DN27649_c0_g1_i1.p1 TRINITY_DN27649_c0_g1~~TRINITY_DN27649_c0_g1_i1.p1  ORF type:complete len:263 (+),score=55.51 TRINITY_DN27649_c0_g1_i1:194-982(+)
MLQNLRRPAQVLRRQVSIRRLSTVAENTWHFDFQITGSALHAEYDLPQKILSPREASQDFIQNLKSKVREGPTELLDASSHDSLKNAVCTLKLLDDLQKRIDQLMEEERIMEAISLLTAHWQVIRGTDTELLRISARRNLHDRIPAAATLATVAALLGAEGLGLPEAWLLMLVPGGLAINELVMRRVQNHSALTKTTYVYGMAKAAFSVHISRAVPTWDTPFVVTLDKYYSISPANVSSDDLMKSINEGSYGELVTGEAHFW